MPAAHHIINELVFEVNTNNLKTAFYLKDNAEVLLKEHIYPQLEVCFNSHGTQTDAQILRLQHMKIETHVEDATSFEDIGINVAKQIREQLQLKGVAPILDKHSYDSAKGSINNNGSSLEIERTTRQQSGSDAVLYFIENGRLPWWHHAATFFTIEDIKTSTARGGFKMRLQKLLAQKSARQRIIHQFDDRSIASLVSTGTTEQEKWDEKEMKPLAFLFQNSSLRNEFWHTIFQYQNQKNDAKLITGVRRIIAEAKPITRGNNTGAFKTGIDGLKHTMALLNFVNNLVGTGYILKKKPTEAKSDSWTTLRLLQARNETAARAENTRLWKTISDSKKTKIRIDLRITSDHDSTISENKSSTLLEGKNPDPISNNGAQSSEDKNFTHLEDSSKGNDPSKDSITDSISSEKTVTETIDGLEATTFTELDFDAESRDSSVHVEEGTIFSNAGLILLHPFLKRFFENLEFLENNKIVPEKLEEALHLLHYVACKKEQPYEHELLFEKFICNVPLKHPVRKDIQLSEKQKESCNVLLSSALHHWDGLKTNSVDALRSEFLMREGRLLTTEEHYKLFVQRKTQDILLETLPWNLSLAKIPWKKKMILIDW